MAEPLLEITGLAKRYGRDGVAALDGVDLALRAGETLGLVGRSGSGKTTLARCILRLVEPDAGSIRFEGTDLLALRGARLRAMRPGLQMVFQDPAAAFNPRATIARLIEDPLRLHVVVPPERRRQAVLELLDRVRLPAAIAGRRPHEISGGERQRVAIARAIATRPKLIVLDEPVSALDASVRAQILNLLMDIRDETGVAYLLISHDLAVVRALAAGLVVLDEGRVVESGAADAIFAAPRADATRRLVEAVPRLRR